MAANGVGVRVWRRAGWLIEKQDVEPHRVTPTPTLCAAMLVRLLLSIDRRQGTEEALDTVRLAATLRPRGVVGIDVSGNPTVRGRGRVSVAAGRHAATELEGERALSW